MNHFIFFFLPVVFGSSARKLRGSCLVSSFCPSRGGFSVLPPGSHCGRGHVHGAQRPHEGWSVCFSCHRTNCGKPCPEARVNPATCKVETTPQVGGAGHTASISACSPSSLLRDASAASPQLSDTRRLPPFEDPRERASAQGPY